MRRDRSPDTFESAPTARKRLRAGEDHARDEARLELPREAPAELIRRTHELDRPAAAHRLAIVERAPVSFTDIAPARLFTGGRAVFIVIVGIVGAILLGSVVSYAFQRPAARGQDVTAPARADLHP